ncbi:hypothetical protein D9M70_564350 [compost metagenome]
MTHEQAAINLSQPPDLAFTSGHFTEVGVGLTDLPVSIRHCRSGIKPAGGSNIKILLKNTDPITTDRVFLVGVDIVYTAVQGNVIYSIIQRQPEVIVAVNKYIPDVVILKAVFVGKFLQDLSLAIDNEQA